MFEGHYLKINGEVYPNRFLVIPSYRVEDNPIVIKTYYDAEYGKHIITAPRTDLMINFDIRSMYNTEYPEAVQPFNGVMQIEYFDSKINGYKTDSFVCTNNLNPQISRQYNNEILYEQLSITLMRVAV